MSVIVVCFHYCLSYGCLYLLRFQIFSQNPLEQIEPIFFLERYLGGP